MPRAERTIAKGVAAVAVIVVVVLVAYGAVTDARPAPPADLAATRPEPVLVQSTVRLTAVAPDVGDTTVSVRSGISSPDGTRVFRGGRSATGASRLTMFDPTDGSRTWSTPIPEGTVARVSNQDGSAVVIGEPAHVDATGYPYGRSITELFVLPTDGEEIERYDLTGNFEPEAFSRDSESVFLVEYVPADLPTGYRVRELDRATGRVHPVESPDITPSDTMGGTARTQVLAPDGRRLYTLYSIAPGVDGGHHGTDQTSGRAFVHVLDLEEKWAHCIDLPAPFGTDPFGAAALAVSPDGDDLFVTDTATGTVARVDTVNLSPDEVADPGLSVVASAAAVNDDGTLFVGGGGRLEMVDTATMSVTGGWTTGGLVESLELGDDDDLYVATPGRITIVAPSGDRRRVDLADDSAVVLGQGGFGLLGNRQVIECAC